MAEGGGGESGNFWFDGGLEKKGLLFVVALRKREMKKGC